MTAIGTSQAQAAPQATSHGCPSGYVCFYPGAGWNGDRPSRKFFTYGAHNLSNVVGTYRVYNNQTDNAYVRTCTGYNGTGCEGYIYARTSGTRSGSPPTPAGTSPTVAG